MAGLSMRQEEVQTEQDALDEAAALEAMFSGGEETGGGQEATDAQAPAAEEDSTTPPETTDEQAQIDAAVAAVAAEGKPLTEESLAAALAAAKEEWKAENGRLRDKVFGKVGNLEEKLSKIQGISPQKKASLAKHFPELAELLFDNEETILPVATPSAEPAETKAPDVDVDDKIAKAVERGKLDVLHEDWEEVASSTDFATWAESALSAEELKQLNSTWDAKYVSSKLSAFKSYQEKQTADVQARAAKVKIGQERLAAAVNPRGLPREAGTGINTDDEEAAMEKAFKS